MTLSPAWPSSPTRPAKFALWMDELNSGRRMIETAYSMYAIRKVFDFVIDGVDAPHQWRKRRVDEVLIVGPFQFKSDQLRAIIDHTYTEEERQWELPDMCKRILSKFKGVQEPPRAKQPEVKTVEVSVSETAGRKRIEQVHQTPRQKVAAKPVKIPVSELVERVKAANLWKPQYEKLSAGLLAMTCRNVLKIK